MKISIAGSPAQLICISPGPIRKRQVKILFGLILDAHGQLGAGRSLSLHLYTSCLAIIAAKQNAPGHSKRESRFTMLSIVFKTVFKAFFKTLAPRSPKYLRSLNGILALAVFISVPRADAAVLHITEVSSKPATAPKYPSDVTPLSKDHRYLQMHSARSFWALMPYLNEQKTNSSCSVATAATVLNAARTVFDTHIDEPLASEASVLQKTGDAKWKTLTEEEGGGVGLAFFSTVFAKALTAHGFTTAHLTSTAETGLDPEALSALRNQLDESEKTGQTFVIVNFDQGFVMDEESVGHFAVIGAYDAETDRALVLDPDKASYEPYWVKLSKLYQAMLPSRGYLTVIFP